MGGGQDPVVPGLGPRKGRSASLQEGRPGMQGITKQHFKVKT